MTSTSGQLEFLHRPYPYSRSPFRLDENEIVGYEGRFFSIPAFGMLLDKRLFTDATSHPVDTPIKLYINKDSGTTESIEPSLSASGYERGTPHYSEVILDLRTLLEDVCSVHAGDSSHSASDFFRAHMQRNRAIYNLSSTSSSGISDEVYVHPAPQNAVPSGATPPGVSGSIPPPGDGFELGARQFKDIDIDEIQWQPFTRPNDLAAVQNIPVEPIFPAVVNNGNTPSLSVLDVDTYNSLALGAATSGGLLLTGDALVDNTSIKLLTGSGAVPVSSGSFRESVPWKCFPCEQELNRYYETPSGTQVITASGRQAIYSIPSNAPADSVLLLDVSEAGTSGVVIQTYPSNYYATSGIDANGVAHGGVHNTDRLLYNLREMSPGQPVLGRSPINGKIVFAHFAGTETDFGGRDVGNASFKYANNNTVYGAGTVNNRNIVTGSTDVQWFSTDNTLSPANWATVQTTAFGVSFIPFTKDRINVYTMSDINHSPARIISRQEYAGWGFVDRLVAPDSDRGQGGQAASATINYVTRIYRQGRDAAGGLVWNEEPNSPATSSSDIQFFKNTYFVNNIFSFFFNKRPNFGLTSVNGDIFFQWSEKSALLPATLPRHNLFAPFGQGTFRQVPPTARSESRVSIGVFPNWVILRYVTTNNQVTVPDSIDISPSKSSRITFHPDLNFDDTLVEEFGPACWDENAGVNYIYFILRPAAGVSARGYFAKMNTDFQIIQFNAVNSEDLILNGRMAVLSI